MLKFESSMYLLSRTPARHRPALACHSCQLEKCAKLCSASVRRQSWQMGGLQVQRLKSRRLPLPTFLFFQSPRLLQRRLLPAGPKFSRLVGASENRTKPEVREKQARSGSFRSGRRSFAKNRALDRRPGQPVDGPELIIEEAQCSRYATRCDSRCDSTGPTIFLKIYHIFVPNKYSYHCFFAVAKYLII